MIRRRQLSQEEHALWSGFARSIKPLQQSQKFPKPSAAPATTRKPAQTTAPPRPIAPPPAPKSPPLAPLGRRLKQRVARGREPIDDRIDLHGLTQTQAHAALTRFLRRAQADGARIVLVVTGKGSGKVPSIGERDSTIERGVLRRQVPMWLALPEFRPLIVGFEDAHAGHGGQGALYVRLRRGW
jgi:DNA-nicking Smr family endonuclease